MHTLRAWLGVVFLLGSAAAVVSACGGDEGTSPVTMGTSSSSSSGTGSSSGGTAGGGGMSGTGGSTGAGGSQGAIFTCADAPPPGAVVASPPPPYSGGTCPALAPGFNTFDSKGNSRQFMLVLPTDYKPGEKLPVIFLWHWLGGSAQDFFDKGDIQTAVDTQHFIAVIPESKDDITFKWPFDLTVTQDRVDEEFVFFDDMLSCVSEQYSVNENCVASAGVSAGALFTDQLAGGRGQYLSSILSLSGGVGGPIRPWGKPEHKMPAVVLWGGPSDQCFFVMNFDTASKELEKSLGADGHFFLECIHNCGHAEPPLDAPPDLTKFASLWQFVFDHPYWLKAGESPYLQKGLPATMPSWCGIGAMSSTPRTGNCPNPPGC